MFRGLRLQLTVLYALAGLALVALVGGGAYVLVARHERALTDLGLQHKMAHELHGLGAPIPAELALADRDWSLVRDEAGLLPLPRRSTSVAQNREGHDDDPDDEHAGEQRQPLPAGDTQLSPTPQSQDYDSELAAIYVLPLDPTGLVWVDPRVARPPFAPDHAALATALAAGSDLRTITTLEGQHVRLLTYRLAGSGPAALQLGRVLDDQELLLRQLVMGLLALGALGMALLGAGSWWLAGRALRPAQAAWERQRGFIASASHELRTPLTILRTSAELMQRWMPASAADEHELLRDMVTESDHMRRLVDDLLTVTRIDTGQLPLEVAPVELAPLLVALQRQAARLGAERGVAVVLGESEGVARADLGWLRQILLNLIDNALRHTPSGGQIRLAAQAQGREVCISVADTGCGIAPEHLPHIFERFYRADPARGRAGGNAGLGLSIVQGVVKLMGGQIAAESVLGQGTTIRLTFPTA